MLEQKVLNLARIKMLLVMLSIKTIGWHSVTSGFGVPQGVTRYKLCRNYRIFTICPRTIGKMKVLQRKVLTLITIKMFLGMKCIDTIGWHSVTNGLGFPRGGNKIQNTLKS